MSSENNQRASGLRRKARECALQMLFAADLVGPERFSVNNFWGEIGFGEVCPELRKSVGVFLERSEKIAKEALDLRPIAKKTDPLEKTNSRIEKLKNIAAESEKAVASFRKFIDGTVTGSNADLSRTREHLDYALLNTERFFADFESTGALTNSMINGDERLKYNEFKNHAEGLITEIKQNILPEIESHIESVKPTREFADKLAVGTLDRLQAVDDKIKTRAEHWRIERMAIVDRNVLRLAVFEFLFEDTPRTVVINEALEIARYFSTFEATQFINGILDAIKLDLEKENWEASSEKSSASSS